MYTCNVKFYFVNFFSRRDQNQRKREVKKLTDGLSQKDKPTDPKSKRKGDVWRFTVCTLIYVINPDTVMKKRHDKKAQPLRWCYTGQLLIQHCCAKNRYVFMAINLLQQRCKNLKSVQSCATRCCNKCCVKYRLQMPCYIFFCATILR